MKSLILALALFSLAGCSSGFTGQPLAVEPVVDNKVGSEAAFTPQTQLSAFYGVYETIEQNSLAVIPSTLRPMGNACETRTNIGNANIKRDYPPNTAGTTASRSVVLDYFDHETNEALVTDEIWISPGVLSSPELKAYCSEFAVPLFRDKGEWAKSQNYLKYSFSGIVRRKMNQGESATTELKEVIEIERLENNDVRVKIAYKSSTGSFGGTWTLRKASK